MNDVTRILHAIDQGDPQAADELLPVVYRELRELAAKRLAREKPGQTLDATALVHEAYVRLVGAEKEASPNSAEEAASPLPEQQWDSRGHFFSAAAEAMRRILVERARRKAREKHGGGRRRVPLEEAELAAPAAKGDLLALDEALDRLAAKEPQKAELVKLRYFAGLTSEQAAEVLGISRATAARHWTYARAWLYNALGDGEEGGRRS
jgi:RNA polymerase sigma factor (TIGR02999 family)